MDDAKAKIEDEIIRVKRDIQELERELIAYNTRKANLWAEYERYRMRNMPSIWFFLVICLSVGEYMTLNAGLIWWAVICRIVFLFNWRNLYVKEIPYSRTVGLAVLAILIFILVK